MMKQSYTSFLNNVHKKANIHIFVIKVNKSTGQRVNKLGPIRLISPISPIGPKTEHRLNPLKPN